MFWVWWVGVLPCLWWSIWFWCWLRLCVLVCHCGYWVWILDWLGVGWFNSVVDVIIGYWLVCLLSLFAVIFGVYCLVVGCFGMIIWLVDRILTGLLGRFCLFTWFLLVLCLCGRCNYFDFVIYFYGLVYLPCALHWLLVILLNGILWEYWILLGL